MIGLDTNILVRHIAQDDAAQSPRATKLIESFTDERPGYVALVVLVETIWVFQRRYDATRSDIARLIETLLRIDGIRVEHPEIVWAALRLFQSSNVGFADCLIARANQAAGCDYTATFDEKAGKIEGMKSLS